MLSESEIHNCKKIFLDETHCYGQNCQNYEAEKVFDEMIEKSRNFDFSEFQDKEEAIDKWFETVEMPAEFASFLKRFCEMIEKLRNFDFSKFQDKEKAIDKLFEKVEMPTEFVAFIKDNFVNDPALSSEERFKKGLLLGKELFYRIKQKSH